MFRVLGSAIQDAGPSVSSMKAWPVRRWVIAVLAGCAAALVIGVPTGIVQTNLYTRMTPVRWWDYPVWAASAVLVGLTAATYTRGGPPSSPRRGLRGRTVGATVLSTFAVGCPICNKLVVAVLGVSGALSYWAPLQPALGMLSVALLGAGLLVRLRGSLVCDVTPASAG